MHLWIGRYAYSAYYAYVTLTQASSEQSLCCSNKTMSSKTMHSKLAPTSLHPLLSGQAVPIEGPSHGRGRRALRGRDDPQGPGGRGASRGRVGRHAELPLPPPPGGPIPPENVVSLPEQGGGPQRVPAKIAK